MREDEELRELRRKKDELVKRVMELRDKLQQQGAVGEKRTISLDEIKETLSEDAARSAKPDPPTDEERFIVRLVEAAQQATGVSFDNIDKKWVTDNTWNYTAEVVGKALKFELNLTVDMTENGNNEIIDITCRFKNVIDCLLQEVTSWVQIFTRAKKFTYLMSAFSEYNDQCIVRQKILDKLSKQKCALIDMCPTGGYLIHVHAPSSTKDKFVKFLWTMQFNPKMRTIDHSFTIDGIEPDFMEANQELLQDFCQKGLKKEDLENLWAELCTAVNEYKQ